MIVDLPQVLVVSHAGIRGYYELGYLHILEEKGILKQVDTYVGVSVGAIISLFLACGYKPDEIAKIALVSDMLSMACFTSLSKTWDNKGLLTTEYIEETLIKHVESKLFHIPSYRRLFDITGKTLCTVAVELKSNMVRYFDPISTPDVSCVEGVMLSIIIPFIMQDRKFENNSYIDGAIGNPYPVDQYDNGETSILGISVTTKYDLNDDNDFVMQMMSIVIHLLQVFDAFMQCHKNRIIEKCSDKVMHMEIVDNSLDFIGITKGEREKANMMMKGVMMAEKDLEEVEWIENKTVVRMEPRARVI